MSIADSLEGAAYFLPALAAAIATAFLLVKRRYTHLAGVQRALALCVFATAAEIFAHVIPAALGILSRPSALVCALAIVLLAWRVPAREPAVERAPAPPPAPSSVPSIVIGGLAITIMVVYQLGRARTYLPQPPQFIDALGFHLPGVVSWIQSGTLWRVDQFLPGFATAQYPNNGDFLLLASVLPWHDLAFVRLAMLPFFALTGVATYALATEAGASRAAATTFGAACLTVPEISRFAFEGIPDFVTLSMLGIGLVFLVRHLRTGLATDLVLGGLALGISFGSKWYGVTAVAVVVAVWLAAWFLADRSVGAAVRNALVVVGMVALGGGIWLVRNLIESGNPLYPKAVSLLGIKLFPGSHRDVIDQYGFAITHYLGNPGILRHDIYPGFKIAFGIVGLVILAGLAVVAVVFVRALRTREHEPAATRRAGVLLVVTFGIFVTYVITPGSAYGPQNLPYGAAPTLRWLMPAAVVGLALAAVAVRYLGRVGWLLELAGLAGLVDGISYGEDVATGLIAKVVLLLAVAAFVLVLGRRWVTSRAAPRLTSRPLRFAVVAGLVVAVVGAIRVQQAGFNRTGYSVADPVFAWINTHAPSGHRVGITGAADLNGLAAVLPLAGPRLGNQISYVGDNVVHSIQLPSSAVSFGAELRRGRIDLLEIGLHNTGHTDVWARALGFRLLVSSPRLALYAAPSR